MTTTTKKMDNDTRSNNCATNNNNNTKQNCPAAADNQTTQQQEQQLLLLLEAFDSNGIVVDNDVIRKEDLSLPEIHQDYPHFFIYSSKTPLHHAKLKRDLKTEEERSCFDRMEEYIHSNLFIRDVLIEKKKKQEANESSTTSSKPIIRIDLSKFVATTSSAEEEIVDDHGLILDAFSIVRFCSARKFDFNNSKDLLVETISWRLEKKPHLITKEQVKVEIDKDKGVWHKYSKLNNPIIYISPQNHVTYDRDFDTTLNFTLYMGEMGMKMIRDHNQQHVLPLLKTRSAEEVLEKYVEQYMIVYDGRTIAMKNCDVAIIKEFLRISNYYAERLSSVVVYYPNWTYKILLKMISPFVDKKTCDKIRVAYNVDEVSDLLDAENVPTHFGGQCSLLTL